MLYNISRYIFTPSYNLFMVNVIIFVIMSIQNCEYWLAAISFVSGIIVNSIIKLYFQTKDDIKKLTELHYARKIN